MKKKTLTVLFAFFIALSLCACGTSKDGNSDDQQNKDQELPFDPDMREASFDEQKPDNMQIVQLPIEEEKEDESENTDTSDEDTQDNGKLPKYKSAQSGSIEEAITLYMWDEFGFKEPDDGSVAIPAYVIIKTTETDDITNVYGDFWVYTYKLEDKNMMCESGGSYPGVFHLRQNENGYEVASFDMASDGSGYMSSLEKMCDGDEELQQRFLDVSSADNNECINARISFLRWYAYDNELEIETYQDFGWDPVSLSKVFEDEEKTEEQDN